VKHYRKNCLLWQGTADKSNGILNQVFLPAVIRLAEISLGTEVLADLHMLIIAKNMIDSQ
jgi:hypothetical protein